MTPVVIVVISIFGFFATGKTDESRLSLRLFNLRPRFRDIVIDDPPLSCLNDYSLEITQNDQISYAAFKRLMILERTITIKDFEVGLDVIVKLIPQCENASEFYGRIHTGGPPKTEPLKDIHREPRADRRISTSLQPASDWVKATLTAAQTKCSAPIHSVNVRNKRMEGLSKAEDLTVVIARPTDDDKIDVQLDFWIDYYIDIGVWCGTSLFMMHTFVEAMPGKPKGVLEVELTPREYSVTVKIIDYSNWLQGAEYRVLVCPVDTSYSKCQKLLILRLDNETRIDMGGLHPGIPYNLDVAPCRTYNDSEYLGDAFNTTFTTPECGPPCSGLGPITNVVVDAQDASAILSINSTYDEILNVKFNIKLCPPFQTDCLHYTVPRNGTVTVTTVTFLVPQRLYTATITPLHNGDGIQTGPKFVVAFATRACKDKCPAFSGNLTLRLIKEELTTDVLVELPRVACDGDLLYHVAYGKGELVTAKAPSVTLKNLSYFSVVEIIVIPSCVEKTLEIYAGIIDTGPGGLKPISHLDIMRDSNSAKISITCSDDLNRYPDKFLIRLCASPDGQCLETKHAFTDVLTCVTLNKLHPKREYEVFVIPYYFYRGKPYAGESVNGTLSNPHLKD